MQQKYFSKLVYLLVTSRLTLTLQLSYCENPLITTLRRLLGYTEGEFSMTNTPNKHVFRTVGGNQSIQGKPMQKRGERADSTQTVTQARDRTWVPSAVRQLC